MKRVRRGLTVLAIVAVAAGAAVFAQRPTEASSAEAKALPPLAWTTHAEAGVHAALLFGRFNPRGHRTVIQFQYGLTKRYGSLTPTYPEEEWFGNEVNEEEEFTERLRAGTLYHYRILARSKVGTTYGKDKTFRTKSQR